MLLVLVLGSLICFNVNEEYTNLAEMKEHIESMIQTEGIQLIIEKEEQPGYNYIQSLNDIAQMLDDPYAPVHKNDIAWKINKNATALLKFMGDKHKDLLEKDHLHLKLRGILTLLEKFKDIPHR